MGGLGFALGYRASSIALNISDFRQRWVRPDLSRNAVGPKVEQVAGMDGGQSVKSQGRSR
jgi:hypothetical protein